MLMLIKSIKKLKINNFLEFKNIYYLLPLIIITSSFKFLGYGSSFILFIPFVINKRKEIIYMISTSSYLNKVVLFYFLFLILEVFIGSFYIKDLRILIYWIPFFTVCISIYFYNLYSLSYFKLYRNKYKEILYISSIYYFILYGFMVLLSILIYKNPYDIQNQFWMGSTTSFSLGSIFFITKYYLWEKINFRLNSKFTYALLYYIVLAFVSQSRVGFLYLILFFIFFLIKALTKKYYSKILVIFFSSFFVYLLTFNNFSRYYPSPNNVFQDILGNTIRFVELDDRFFEFEVGLNKFKEMPKLNKIIGTGWYSSRITLATKRNKMINDRRAHIPKSIKSSAKITPQGIVALLIDTGIFGLAFGFIILKLNFLLLVQIKEDIFFKVFLLCVLSISLLSLLSGYPLVNIFYILFLLPQGILNFTSIKS